MISYGYVLQENNSYQNSNDKVKHIYWEVKRNFNYLDTNSFEVPLT